jgi:hypothetical protein
MPDGDGNLHACHTQDWDQYDSCSQVHLKMPDEPYGEYSQSEVSDNSEAAVGIRNDNENVGTNACPVSGSCPEIGYRRTLQERNEEEDNPANNANS